MIDFLKKIVKNKYAQIGLIVAGGFVGYKFIGSINKKKRNAELKKIANSEMEVALQNSTQQTIDEMRAVEIAKALFTAMDGVGTDENAIEDILILRNRFTSGDIILINNAFGLQEYGTTGSPYWGSGTPLNLVGWFKQELSNTSDLYKVLQTKFNQAGIYWD